MEARPAEKPDGSCGDCGDPVQIQRSTGRLLNLDGTSHDRTHVERLRELSLEVCDALEERRNKNEIRAVEIDEKNCDGFKITTKTGITYWFRCNKMEPSRRKR